MLNTEQIYTETITKSSLQREPARGVFQNLCPAPVSCPALKILTKYLCKGVLFLLKLLAIGVVINGGT